MADASKATTLPGTPEPTPTVVKMARAIVAKGRTVMAQTGERRTVNYTSDGTPVTRLSEQVYKPGQEIELPEHEVAHLRAAGFLVDPNATAPKSDIGPTFERKPDP